MANTAFTQQALANDPQFRLRFLGLLTQMAAQILNTTIGQGSPPVTAGQQTYARSIVAAPQQFASTLIQYFVYRPNIFQSTVSVSIAEGSAIVSTDATDAAILSQLASDWPSISGA